MANPNGPGNFVGPVAFENGVDRFPNDRPHVLKLSGPYRFGVEVGVR